MMLVMVQLLLVALVAMTLPSAAGFRVDMKAKFAAKGPQPQLANQSSSFLEGAASSARTGLFQRHVQAALKELKIEPAELNEESFSSLFDVIGLLRSKAVISRAGAVLPKGVACRKSRIHPVSGLPPARHLGLLQEFAEEEPEVSATVERERDDGFIYVILLVIVAAVALTTFWCCSTTRQERQRTWSINFDALGTASHPLDMRGPTTFYAPETSEDTLVAIAQEGLGIAIPTTMMTMLCILSETASTVFLGRVGTPAQLAGIGLANMCINMTYVSIGSGTANVMDTLVSQAFGAGYHQLCCTYMQRCRLLATLHLVWIWPLLWWADAILVFTGQNPEVALNAGYFCKLACISSFLFFQTISVFVFLKNRGDVLPIVVAFAGGNLVHIFCCYLFILELEWGTFGCGLAACLNAVTMFLMSHIYLVFFSEARYMSKWHLLFVGVEAFRDLWTYLRLAVPSIATSCMELWYWELNTLMLGLLGTAQLAAHVATINFEAICAMVIIGVGSATGTVVGRAIGTQRTKKARRAAMMGLGTALAIWALIAILICVLRRGLADIYTKNVEVESILATLVLFIAVAGFFNSAQAVAAGVLRGLGMQRFVAVCHFFSYYVVALLSGFILAFWCDWSVYGIYSSFVLGTALVAFLFVGALYEVDWDSKVLEMHERLGSAQKVNDIKDQ